ncbi:MAG: 4-alpha-glucanotransferase [Clostridium sp.]
MICSGKWSRLFGWKQVIAEDLGYVTDSVRRLVQESGFPGMKVLEFAFDSRDSGCANDYLPHNYTENSVAYTGAHDNETLAGWWKSITLRKNRSDGTGLSLRPVYSAVEAWKIPDRSDPPEPVSSLCDPDAVIYGAGQPEPDQHALSTVGTNWKWRLAESDLTEGLKQEIRSMTLRYGRMNWS